MRKPFNSTYRFLGAIFLLNVMIDNVNTTLSHIEKLCTVLHEYTLQDILVTFVVLILVWTLEKIFEKGLK